MHKHYYSNSFFVFIILIVCVVFSMFYINNLYSGSVDVAHVYALVYRLSTDFVLSATYDTSLGEMNFYPPGSHLVAVIFGRLLGSAYLGMQFTAFFSVVTTWIFLFLILSLLPKQIFRISSFFTLLLTLLIGVVFSYPVHGDEIISNYFYSQSVGFAICYFCFFLILYSEIYLKINTKLNFALIFASSYTLEYFHLLPALLLLSVALGLIALDYIECKNKTVVKTLLYGAVLFAMFFIFYLNPAFQSMRQIADNDGDMNLGGAKYPLSLVFSSCTIMVLSQIILKKYYQLKENARFIVFKYIALYGAAAAALCLLQLILFYFFSIGSNYAVKKYFLVVDTILIIQISILLAYKLKNSTVLAVILNKNYIKEVTGLNAFFIIAPPLLVLSSLFYGKEIYEHSSKIVRFENDIQHLQELNYYPNENMIVKGTNKNTINYMFSTAILKTSREVAIPEVLLSNNVNYSLFDRLVVMGENKQSECIISHYGSASILDTKCTARLENQCTQTFLFSENNLSLSNVLSYGFGSGERNGRWSIDNKALFQCNNNDYKLTTITIKLRPFITNDSPIQHIKILVNGVEKVDTSFREPKEESIIIPIQEFSNSKKINISFIMPDSKSPKMLGINKNDDRKLAFFFTEINVK